MLDKGIFSGTFGLAVNPGDLRPLTEQELEQMQIANLAAAQQSRTQPYEYEAMRNYLFDRWPSPPVKPLDERFADFKARLALAVEKLSKP